MDEAEASQDEVIGLLHSKLYAKGLDCLIITLQLFKALHDLRRHFSLREFAHSLEAVVAVDGHDARQDFTLDAGSATVSDPVKENLVVEEELGDDEVSPSIHLLLQVADIIVA